MIVLFLSEVMHFNLKEIYTFSKGGNPFEKGSIQKKKKEFDPRERILSF